MIDMPGGARHLLSLRASSVLCSHIAECRSNVADDKIGEIPPRLIDPLGLKWPPISIEFGKNYFRLCCCYSIDIIAEECGSAGDGRWLGF